MTGRSVVQDWVSSLPFMQQTVLLTTTRGPDGVAKYEAVKYLLRWVRRCILISAFDGRVLTNPYEEGGGSFTGPSIRPPVIYDALEAKAFGPLINQPKGGYLLPWEDSLNDLVSSYLKSVDSIPHHFHLHLMHGLEILGYKHPDERIRSWFNKTYVRFVEDIHLWPETMEQMDRRLGDTREGWLERADKATIA